jgi:hypothetical protein
VLSSEPCTADDCDRCRMECTSRSTPFTGIAEWDVDDIVKVKSKFVCDVAGRCRK